MSLQEEIEAGRQTIRTESYSMSIGELANLYRNGELVIRPEFQRLFRWKIAQKSRLIESLLLGIPLPSIFVNQRHSGVWEVVDGLQRLSTILEFMGELKDQTGGALLPASTLSGTKYLPSLEGMVYEQPNEQDSMQLTPGQRLALKRSKIDLKILQPESDAAAKYELFDRLNTGGSVATPQEVRNAQILLRDPTMAEWLNDLSENEHYTVTLSISERLREEGYGIELIYRYLAIRYTKNDELANIKNIDEFFSNRVFELAADSEFDREEASLEFASAFKLISAAGGEDAFRRYDGADSSFKGAFSVSAFECVGVGVSSNLSFWLEKDALTLGQRIKDLWSQPEFKQGSRSGTSASSRIPRTIPFSISFFSN
ncbi:GmrSD restriction endonuclease domain-containing protein [Nocardia vaccinii]|uniref:GmrSD restriction endonuclease domain-containing protein n=1 Tax=Nocardia vaccinii TaxID=1822 RepID=UPI00082F585C|nr:DUF262 domain-containing protein [Nocardia vaccinii]